MSKLFGVVAAIGNIVCAIYVFYDIFHGVKGTC